MQILGKTSNTNMRQDICFYVTSNSKVKDCAIKYTEHILNTRDELLKEEKPVYNKDDFTNVSTRKRTNELVRVKKLEDQKRAGYVMISSLTCLGTLILAGIIFIAVKLILG